MKLQLPSEETIKNILNKYDNYLDFHDNGGTNILRNTPNKILLTINKQIKTLPY